MRTRSKYLSAALGIVVVGGAVAMGVWALTSSKADQPPPPPAAAVTDLTNAPAPPIRNQFIDITGRFFVVPWDDRELGPEQKAANPWYNPAWEQFSECATKGGLQAKLDPSKKFSQVDLDRLVAQLNREYPDAEANKQIPAQATGKVRGDAGVFLTCAEEWLTKTPRQMYELTGVPNQWWPPTTGVASPSPAR